MFESLTELVVQLNEIDDSRIKTGHYPTCKEARRICQEIKVAAQDLRVEIIKYAKGEQGEGKGTISQDPGIPTIEPTTTSKKPIAEDKEEEMEEQQEEEEKKDIEETKKAADDLYEE